MKRDSSSLRPWPFALLAVVFITTGTALLNTDEAREGAGEALIVMGGLVVGAWVAMVAASLGGKTISGFSERDREGPRAAPAQTSDDEEEPDGPPHPRQDD